MKRLLAWLTAVFCVIIPLTSAAPASDPAPPVSGQATVDLREETVYGILDAYGTQEELMAVVRLRVASPGHYTDGGKYAQVVNLTNSMQPTLGPDGVSWAFAEAYPEFYYQGKLPDAQPPFSLCVSYTLGGEAANPSALAGASGRVGIKLDVSPSEGAAAYFKQNFMAQVQLELPAEAGDIVSAEGAANMLTGGTRTLSFTVLPGKSASFAVEIEARDFALDAISMAMMPYQLDAMMKDVLPEIDFDEFQSGAAAMKTGAQQLVDGTVALETGAQQLSDGLGQASSSAGQLVDASKQLSIGMTQLNNSMVKYQNLFEQYITGGDQFLLMMQSLTTSAGKLASGVAALDAALTQLNTASGELPTGAQKLIEGEKALQQGLAELQEALDALPGLLNPAGEDEPAPPVSFVTGEEGVTTVQFISRVPGIHAPEPLPEQPPVESPRSFWDRLLDLFR